MKTVFIDLDGTLTDAGTGILNSISHALDEIGYALFIGDGSSMVGPPLWDSFRVLGVLENRLDDAVEHYRYRYTDIGWLENSLYEGVLADLKQYKGPRLSAVHYYFQTQYLCPQSYKTLWNCSFNGL